MTEFEHPWAAPATEGPVIRTRAWEQLTIARLALEAIRDFEDTFGGPPPEDAMRSIAGGALNTIETITTSGIATDFRPPSNTA